jgi:hypothetical protein
MNETRLGIFHRLFYSITSFDKYRLFLRQSTGKAVIYLLLLTMVLSAAIYTATYYRYSEAFDIASEYIINELPDFRFENGKLDVSGEMPITIDSNSIPIVIDTRPDAEDRILNTYDIVMLITSDKLIVKNYIERSEVPLSIYSGLDLTRDELVSYMPAMKLIYGIFIFFAAIIFIIEKFISAFVVSLIGRAVNSIKGTRLSYQSIFKISIYSMTLPLIVFSILNILQLSIPLMWVLFYICCGVYVTGVISRIRSELDAMNDEINGDNME